MKIPFDIGFKSKIEDGEYIVKTRGGDDVNIILWPNDESGQKTIVAKVGDNGISWFSENGKSTTNDSNQDLVLIIPSPPLTDFEKEMINYVRDIIECRNDNDVEDITKRHSKKLIELAKGSQFRNTPAWVITKTNIQRNTLDFLVKVKDRRGNETIMPTNRVLAGEEFIELNTLNSFLKSL